MKEIEVIGARVHNLKNVDVNIPREKLVVVTGLSGSGKSSLAFDTIFAEGQRRYMDTLSAYARQFIGILERPDVDDIKGLSPIIAIEQKTTGKNPRSTVGTITEIYDFLRLLYARAAQAFSPETGKEMIRYSEDKIVELIISNHRGKKILLLAPLVRGRKGHYKELFEQLIKRGYNQVRIDGQLEFLSDVKPLDRYKIHFIELVIDKLVPSDENKDRIKESVLTALNQGKGSLAILSIDSNEIHHLSKNLICPDTGISFSAPAPYTFSFNSPQGACPHCRGLGTIAKVDIKKIIPNESISIADGGILTIGDFRDNGTFQILEAIAKKYQFSLHDPIKKIGEDARNLILYGSDELFRIGQGSDSQMVSFQGVISKVDFTGNESEKMLSKKDVYVEEMVCPLCGGTRLKSEALYFKIDNKNISEVSAMSINNLYDWVLTLEDKLSSKQKIIATDILKELKDRIGFLKEVGLTYLSLDRSTRSLSGGESQRIRLATQIGSKLVNVLYILDEPSIGLHQRDNRKLINSLRRLKDEGNSVMVVEHDMEMMMSSDWLIDLGPGAGEHGGELLYSGEPGKIAESKVDSLTIDYLLGRKKIQIPKIRRIGNGQILKLIGASGNNLKNVTIELPLGTFIGISGVSGSGKSSLINETLMPILSNKFYRSNLNLCHILALKV